MNRCVACVARVARVALPAAIVATLAAASAFAQTPRPFPPTALRGDLVVVQPPLVKLNGQPAQLAPGARIRGPNNLLVMSGAIVDQRLLVHYTREASGALLDVWILSADEAARRPWPATPEQAATWSFDPVAQTWSRP